MCNKWKKGVRDEPRLRESRSRSPKPEGRRSKMFATQLNEPSERRLEGEATGTRTPKQTTLAEREREGVGVNPTRKARKGGGRVNQRAPPYPPLQSLYAKPRPRGAAWHGRRTRGRQRETRRRESRIRTQLSETQWIKYGKQYRKYMK